MAELKVMFGVPTGGTVKARLLTSVVSTLCNAPCPMTLMVPESALGPFNRWAICNAAVKGGYSHVWLVDNDMEFPHDTLHRLLAHGKDLVGAAYNYRGLPARTVVKVEKDGKVFSPETLPDELFQCFAIGSGCKLVTVAALQRMPQPWFALEHHENGSLKMTDDVWFCNQARKAGVETWCDPTIPVKHIGDYDY